MTEPKATQCPVCKKGKREQDVFCSEKCAGALRPCTKCGGVVCSDARTTCIDGNPHDYQPEEKTA